MKFKTVYWFNVLSLHKYILWDNRVWWNELEHMSLAYVISEYFIYLCVYIPLGIKAV